MLSHGLGQLKLLYICLDIVPPLNGLFYPSGI
jgi:hypothetical protein